MQGLRPLQAHQDENSSVIARNILPGKAFGGEEARGGGLGGMKTPKIHNGAGAGGMPSARKALGNITNHGLQASSIIPGKTPAGSVVRKPALGTINTNAARGGEAVALAAAPGEDRITKLAQDGVESLAGKGWDDLERDREARLDAEINDRVAAMASLGRRGLPTYYPHWAKPSNSNAAALHSKENVAATLPSPVKQPIASNMNTSSGSGAFLASLDIFEDEDFGSDDVFLPPVSDDNDLH